MQDCPKVARSAALRLFTALSLMAAVLNGGAAPALSAEPVKKSGYALGEARCGTGALSFPKLQIGMKPGFCAGLVAAKEDGLKFPRSIVQIPDHEQFVISDMGGWTAGQGRLLLLDPNAAGGGRIKEIVAGLDFPFGLAVGPDRKIYASTHETIFRFDPLAANPRGTMETIVKNLPGQRVVLSDGTRVDDSSHLLKQFIFDKTGRIFVNVGSHSDNCITPAPITRPCPAGEGPAPLASIWMFTPPPGGIFPALQANDPNPPREIYARGLRNSMALAVHPDFPQPGFAFLQGENGRDLPDILKPNEEINAVRSGRHYGWPYCYDIATPSLEFKNVLQAPGPYKNFCANAASYQPPFSLLPPHGAPLGMLYYRASRFPELDGKLIVGLHGYRPTGSRVLVYDVDEKGFPKISPPPVRYHISCGPEPTRAFQTERGQAAASAYEELISEWHKVNGVRPQGAPVGLTIASDGAIWLVEDKNQTVIRLDTTSDQPADPLPCDQRSQAQIDELAKFVAGDRQNRMRLSSIRTGLIEKHCVGCHSDFGLRAGQPEAAKDQAVLRFMLSQDGWIYPGDPDSGRLRTRLRGIGAERLMPPGGEHRPRTEPGYNKLLDNADILVGKMVPGIRMRVKPGVVQRRFVSRSGKECGEIPAGKVVVVTQRQAVARPGFSRFYRPADLYLNGECTDADGYYIQQKFLVPL
jgi:glucose/arabinose dehydrogenase